MILGPKEVWGERTIVEQVGDWSPTERQGAVRPLNCHCCRRTRSSPSSLPIPSSLAEDIKGDGCKTCVQGQNPGLSKEVTAKTDFMIVAEDVHSSENPDLMEALEHGTISKRRHLSYDVDPGRTRPLKECMIQPFISIDDSHLILHTFDFDQILMRIAADGRENGSIKRLMEILRIVGRFTFPHIVWSISARNTGLINCLFHHWVSLLAFFFIR
ncbi:unnamed protein product [Toxocara canis]|uniref:Uncharacterized protein n=1 Tax=Toxocara canis TaxID=6265 RepID=A0A183U555_TOXCA|nr:unnamed protein product [Toxocara canis]